MDARAGGRAWRRGGRVVSAMRICMLEEHFRPDDLSITLTCSNRACEAPIRKGDQYGILPTTNLIYCMACSAAPHEIVRPSPRTKPARVPRPRVIKPPRPKKANGGQPLPPGQWAKEHDQCRDCGKTDRPHHSRGLCQRCNSRDQMRTRPKMAALGLACRACGRGDKPMKGLGLCPVCYRREYMRRWRRAS